MTDPPSSSRWHGQASVTITKKTYTRFLPREEFRVVANPGKTSLP
jgi:hypothetical protein